MATQTPSKIFISWTIIFVDESCQPIPQRHPVSIPGCFILREDDDYEMQSQHDTDDPAIQHLFTIGSYGIGSSIGILTSINRKPQSFTVASIRAVLPAQISATVGNEIPFVAMIKSFDGSKIIATGAYTTATIRGRDRVLSGMHMRITKRDMLSFLADHRLRCAQMLSPP